MPAPDKPQHPNKKLNEIFWAFLGGLLFSMVPQMFHTEQTFFQPFDGFAWLGDINDVAHYYYQYPRSYEFGFGFIVTLLLIWSIKKYKKL